MTVRKLILSSLFGLCALMGAFLSAGTQESSKVLVATFSGIISPVASEYMGQAVDKAQADGYSLLVIQLDTPGGLDLSMRDIIKKILASNTPVAIYVAPSGARAASAGVFISLASHVSAMAPGTNIGAAHPVMIGGSMPSPSDKKDEKSKEVKKTPMEEKVLNDAAAYIKAIAEKRGRNTDWAIKAVRSSESISAEEAVKINVVDVMAESVPDLLTKINGKNIDGKVLSVANARLDYMEPSLRQKMLAAISDPNVAMILMSLGAAGLFIELYSPGLILPGVVGAMSLVLAFYSFQTLSANFAGVALILLGLLFFIAEIKVLSYGLLTVGGIISILMGATMLFKSTASFGLQISPVVIFSTIAGLVAITGFVVWIALAAIRRKITTGSESLIGAKGTAKTAINPQGTVFIQGELWDAETNFGTIEQGQEVIIEKIDGFKLIVKPAK